MSVCVRRCKTYKKWCEEHKDQSDNPWTLANIDFGEIEYDKATICQLFDSWYAHYFIVDPCDDFVNELTLTYNLAKDRIDTYYESLDGFDGKDKTIMTVQYGARVADNKDFEYPIDNGTVNPNRKSTATQESFIDTTTVTKDSDPFKRLDKLKENDTFAEFFIRQFVDCFTLVSGMTWC